METKAFDIVLWGASSFVGKIVAKRLMSRNEQGLSIAFAGRNKAKLKQLAESIGHSDIPLLEGDAKDVIFMDKLCKSTRLVISTVGPYALYGECLVSACAYNGTDYCDLTGEPQWIWQMIDKYQDIAKQNGARIMHCCGYDSIPSDIGVYALQQYAKQTTGDYLKQVHYRFKGSKGGMSGGTVASMLNAIESMISNPQSARLLKTPYALVDNKPDNLPYQKSVKGLEKDKTSGHYLLPFIMASINTKVVHRTNYLLDYPWKTDFLYDESMQMGTGIKGLKKALPLFLGLSAFALMARFNWTRNILKKYIVPKPGQGPSDDLVYNGYFNIELQGMAENGQQVVLSMKGKGDPGYGSTSKMICETALLLLNTDKKTTGVGFVTPAAALKESLVSQLQQQADITITTTVKGN